MKILEFKSKIEPEYSLMKNIWFIYLHRFLDKDLQNLKGVCFDRNW